MAFNRPERVTLEAANPYLPGSPSAAAGFEDSSSSESSSSSLFLARVREGITQSLSISVEYGTDHSHVFDQDEIARWTRSECFVEFAVVHPEHKDLSQLPMGDSPSRSWIDAVQVQLQSTCNTGGYG
jgi:hypothetical protein